MAHWKTLFDYKYLGCQDLPRDPNNRATDLVVSIIKIEKQEVVGEKARKDILPVAQLHGAKKPMILNKTNLATLATLFDSSEYEDYIGKPFTLYSAKVKGKSGGIVEGLRIRTEKPTIQAKQKIDLNPSHPRWDGAKKALADGNTTLEAIKQNFSLTAENEAALLN